LAAELAKGDRNRMASAAGRKHVVVLFRLTASRSSERTSFSGADQVTPAGET
jgi:hypothetical protein